MRATSCPCTKKLLLAWKMVSSLFQMLDTQSDELFFVERSLVQHFRWTADTERRRLGCRCKSEQKFSIVILALTLLEEDSCPGIKFYFGYEVFYPVWSFIPNMKFYTQFKVLYPVWSFIPSMKFFYPVWSFVPGYETTLDAFYEPGIHEAWCLDMRLHAWSQSSYQGCQIFLRTKYLNWDKYTKFP
jgi:hypothetical protein